MAKMQVVEEILTDDIDGGRADTTIGFTFDGVEYEIELNKKNASSFTKVMKLYTDHARPVRGSRRKAARKHKIQADSTAVRAWANSNGYHVAPRGRIAREVVEAFNAAQS